MPTSVQAHHRLQVFRVVVQDAELHLVVWGCMAMPKKDILATTIPAIRLHFEHRASTNTKVCHPYAKVLSTNRHLQERCSTHQGGAKTL